MKLTVLRKFLAIFRIIWRKLSWLERLIIFVLLLVVALQTLNISQNFYYRNAQIVPKSGGVLVEGMLGSPKSVNPLFARSETDKTLSSLIFTGLVCYDQERVLIPCLAERWEVSSDKKRLYILFKEKYCLA